MTKQYRATGARTRRAAVRQAPPALAEAITARIVARATALAQHQDAENSAPNDTGVPTTPLEAGGQPPKDGGGQGPDEEDVHKAEAAIQNEDAD